MCPPERDGRRIVTLMLLASLPRRVRFLVLGGTRFIGRATVARLLAAGHDVTLLHRGRTNDDLFPGARHVRADRATVARALPAGEAWDAVLDTSGYFPGDVERAVEALRGRVPRYVYVSSISAYRAWEAPMTEEAPLAACSPEQAVDESSDSYGARKAEGERRLERLASEAGISCAMARLGLVFGPHDYTDRANRWIRAARAGEVPVRDPLHLVPLVFVEDAGAALEAMVLGRGEGPFNVARVVTGEAWLAALAEAVGEFREVPTEGELPLALDSPVTLDARRAEHHLGWRATPLAVALRATAAAVP